MLRVHSPPGHHGAAASSASTTVQCAVSPQKVNSPRSRSPRKAQGAVIDLATWLIRETEIHKSYWFLPLVCHVLENTTIKQVTFVFGGGKDANIFQLLCKWIWMVCQIIMTQLCSFVHCMAVCPSNVFFTESARCFCEHARDTKMGWFGRQGK